MRLRRMKSSQTDCPYSRRAAIGLAVAEGRGVSVMVGLRGQRAHRCAELSGDGGDDLVGLEAELLLQFLEGRRGAERVHAHDLARQADVAGPPERRGLLDGDPR